MSHFAVVSSGPNVGKSSSFQTCIISQTEKKKEPKRVQPGAVLKAVPLWRVKPFLFLDDHVGKNEMKWLQGGPVLAPLFPNAWLLWRHSAS